MKKLFYLSVLAVTVFMMACKKDSPVSVDGYWTGSGLDDGSSTPIFLGMLFRSNSTARAYLGSSDTAIALKVDGTYVIGADSVRTTISNGVNTTVFTGKLSSANTQMNGAFRSLTSTGSGTFSLTKN